MNLTNVMVFSRRSGGTTNRVFGPVELAPGEAAEFSGSYVVPAGGTSVGDIIVVTGMDTCKARTVTARTTCLGPVVQSTLPMIRSVTMTAGVARIEWSATPGVTYTLQCKASPLDPIWIDIPGDVVGTSDIGMKTDAVGPSRQRYYRVMAHEE